MDQFKATNPNITDYNSRQDVEKEYMIGTPQIIKNKLDAFIENGVTHFMFWFMDYPSQEGIKLFAERILPFYR